MHELDDLTRFAGDAGHLAVLAVARPDGTVQASLVSAGVLADPIDATTSVALVAVGGAAKLRLLRANPTATAVLRDGHRWRAVAGRARLVGPDDPDPAVGDLPALLRAVFVAAGGTHDDWDAFDRAMADERRCAVFVHAERVTGNG